MSVNAYVVEGFSHIKTQTLDMQNLKWTKKIKEDWNTLCG